MHQLSSSYGIRAGGIPLSNKATNSSSSTALLNEHAGVVNGQALKIEAIMLTAMFKTPTKINTLSLSSKIRTSEFNERNKSLLLRLRRPTAQVTLYQNGKATMTGLRSLEDATKCCHKLAKILEKILYNVQLMNVHAKNFVLSGCLEKIDKVKLLRAINNEFSNLKISYDPEKQAAINFRYDKVGGMLYTSGKVIINKCLNEEDARIAMEALSKLLQ
ncbi:hypothetical protein GJ496_001136 [Pomphorhynchus laevis]|nr:hypothetical protein GJ496_001136 [Pomphorhynchus laevis]